MLRTLTRKYYRNELYKIIQHQRHVISTLREAKSNNADEGIILIGSLVYRSNVRKINKYKALI